MRPYIGALYPLLLLLCIVNFPVLVGAKIRDCSAVPDHAEDRRSDLVHITIAHFNAEWLMDGVNDPRSPRSTPQEAEEHMTKIAKVIRKMDADIVSLVEVESCDVLAKLNGMLSGMQYRYYMKPGTDSSTGQNVGLLTRVDPSGPLQRTEARHSFPVQYSKCGFKKTGSSGLSKHYYAPFSLPGNLNIDLYGVHFKAIPNKPAACAKREAQAEVLAGFVRETARKRSIVAIVGDMNDFDESIRRPGYTKPKSRVMRTLNFLFDDPDYVDHGMDHTVDPAHPLHGEVFTGEDAQEVEVLGPHGPMINLAVHLNETDRYSNHWDKNKNGVVDGEDEKSLIDHFLVDSNGRHRVESFQILHDHDPAEVSDHWPMVAKFRVLNEPAHRRTRAEARGHGDPWKDDL